MVEGSSMKEFKFLDEETGRYVSVNMTITEGIHLKLLERLANNIKRINNG